MPRIRSIHPGLFTDEAFMTASPHARLLFIGLWGEAWDDGIFEWKPLTLKARLFPADNLDMPALLAEIEGLNFIRRFEAGGKALGAIRNFQRFQRPKKPNSCRIDLPPDVIAFVKGSGKGPEPDDSEGGAGGELGADQRATGSGPRRSQPRLVRERYGTGPEKSPQMEDGGWRREEEDGSVEGGPSARAREAAPLDPPRSPSASSAFGSDDLGPWLRSLVGQEPVLMAIDTHTIAVLLEDGCTRADVEAGIAAGIAAPNFRPRSWAKFEGWIRRAAKDRLAGAPKIGAAAPEDAPLTPSQVLRQRHQAAVSHFRGDGATGWPDHMRPDHPRCDTPEDVLDQARAQVERERTEFGTGAARRPRTALLRPH